jgi:hypothetical protein
VVVLLAYYMAHDILKKKKVKKTTRKLKHKSRTPRTAYLMSSLIAGRKNYAITALSGAYVQR